MNNSKNKLKSQVLQEKLSKAILKLPGDFVIKHVRNELPVYVFEVYSYLLLHATWCDYDFFGIFELQTKYDIWQGLQAFTNNFEIRDIQCNRALDWLQKNNYIKVYNQKPFVATLTKHFNDLTEVVKYAFENKPMFNFHAKNKDKGEEFFYEFKIYLSENPTKAIAQQAVQEATVTKPIEALQTSEISEKLTPQEEKDLKAIGFITEDKNDLPPDKPDKEVDAFGFSIEINSMKIPKQEKSMTEKEFKELIDSLDKDIDF